MNTNDFLGAILNRRSFYHINNTLPVAKERVQEVIEQAVLGSPSAFNSESTRVVVLFNQEHQDFWDIVMNILRGMVPAEHFASTEEKINSFAAGAGTILYYEEMATVEQLQAQFPLYKDNFPIWSSQANAMAQINVWNALELEGIGATLQHYNPLCDEKTKERWNISDSWKLIGQMPFGSITAEADPKTSKPISERVIVHK